MAGREGKTGLARVLPQKYWAENMKADGKKIGNRCKILLLDEDYTPDTESAPLDPSKAEWAWSLTPTTQATATQNFRGGELVKYTYTQGQYIIEGHIEKTEHFEPEQPASGVESALASGEFPSFEGKGGHETPTTRADSAGSNTMIESSKKISSALNKGSLYDLKTDFPIGGDGGKLDIGSILKNVADGGFPPDLESLSGDLVDGLIPDDLGELKIAGVSVDLSDAAKSAAKGIISGEGVGGALQSIGTQVGTDLAGNLTDGLNEKLGVFEEQISDAIGSDIPGLGDITGQLTSTLSNVANTAANDLLVGALRGEVNLGNISEGIVSELSDNLSLNATDLANGSLDGVAGSILKESFSSLTGVMPDGLDVSSLIPEINSSTKSGYSRALDLTPVEDMVSGKDYGFSRKISGAVDKCSYKTTSAVKVDDICIDPVTEEVIDTDEIIDDAVDDVEVVVFNLFNNIEENYSTNVGYFVVKGINKTQSGLVYFPVIDENGKKFSASDAVYPNVEEEEEAPEIIEMLLRDGLLEVETFVSNDIKTVMASGKLQKGIRKITKKLLKNCSASNDEVTFQFSVALATFIISEIEKAIIKSPTFNPQIRQLYYLGVNKELNSEGAVSKVITKDILVSALGDAQEGTSLQKRGFRGKKVVDVANTRKYNEKIRDEVVKIQKKIGYGNSNIDDILSELDVFSERSGYFSKKLKTPSEKSAVNQFDEKIDLLNLPQNGKEKVTTGHGASATVKVVVSEQTFKGKDIKTVKTNCGITTDSIIIENGGQKYNQKKPPTVNFIRKKFPKPFVLSEKLEKAGYTDDEVKNLEFIPAKGNVIIRKGKVIGIDITDPGQGYFYGATVVFDNTHPKTASGEKYNLTLKGGDIIGIGANYNPSSDVIRIKYIDQENNQVETTARATEINPVGLSTNSNELIKTNTVVTSNGNIEQIKQIQNYKNLTQRIVKSIHQPDNVITSVVYETSYITGLTRLVGINTAFSSFNSSPLISETNSTSNLSDLASIRDAAGTKAIFEFDNGSLAQVSYGPNGRIIKFDFNKPIEGLGSMPEIFIDSDTGTGFEIQLKIGLEKIPAEKENTISEQVIETIDNQLYVDGSPVFGQSVVEVSTDCIGETNQIVGYVDGEPYIGPYHIHPNTGVKMVGKEHSSTPHSIIYDTREESLSNTTRRMTRRPTLPTNVSPTSSPAPSPTPTPNPTTPSPTPTPTPSPSPSYTPPSTGY